jgi:FAD dependent oxidoreductase TIGR03364
MPTVTRFDAAVVGAGIVGLAHAFHLSRAGRRTVVFDRDPTAQGASVRNFGMLWPVGQPRPEIHSLALAARRHWEVASREAGFDLSEKGSYHLAHHADEEAVLREFIQITEHEEEPPEWHAPEEVIRRAPLVRTEGLRGAMFSSTERGVDPRQAVHRLADYLAQTGVTFVRPTSVRSIEEGRVVTSDGVYAARQTFVCAGPEVLRAFPELVDAGNHARDLGLCRLQMLRVQGPTGLPRMPLLAAGLTLLHYPAFRMCAGLDHIRGRLAADWPAQVHYGIHGLAAHHADGTLTLGDSHAYDLDKISYRAQEVEDAITEYIGHWLRLEETRVIERWEGVYPVHPSQPYVLEEIRPGVRLVNTFGTGMTLAFGVAERSVQAAFPEVPVEA